MLLHMQGDHWLSQLRVNREENDRPVWDGCSDYDDNAMRRFQIQRSVTKLCQLWNHFSVLSALPHRQAARR